MSKLKHTFKTDTLFKILFTKNQDLLKKLVSRLLTIPIDSITAFRILNTEIPPSELNKKFSRLDIHMAVNEKQVNLEIQVENEGDYTERVLLHWARIYSNTLPTGGDYIDLPQTVIISIMDFTLFKDCVEFHSEFRLLEVKRKTSLTDKQILHFFELPKLPDNIEKDDLLRLWLALFNANTEEDLKMLEELDVPEVNEAITAYRSVTASQEFLEIERMREMTRYTEASSLHHAEKRGVARGAELERKLWENVVIEKDVEIANKDIEIETLRKQLLDLKVKPES